MGVGDPHVPGATLEEDMRRFLVSSGDEFSDFRLTLDGTVIRTHRAVLAARSSYFEGMFRSFAPSDNQVCPQHLFYSLYFCQKKLLTCVVGKYNTKPPLTRKENVLFFSLKAESVME